MCVSASRQVRRSWAPLRHLLCRRRLCPQLYPALAFTGCLLLLLHVVTVHVPGRYDDTPAAAAGEDGPLRSSRSPGPSAGEGVEPVQRAKLPPEPAQGAKLPPEPVQGAKLPPELVQGANLPAEPVQRVDKSPPAPAAPRQAGWMNRRQWLAQPRAVVGEHHRQLAGVWRVTLATQASLDRLALLPELVHHWDGPVSVALFAPDVEHPLAAAFVSYLRRCDDAVRRRVTFSLLAPVNRPARPLAGSGQLASAACGATREVLSSLLRRRPASVSAWRDKMPYPQNTLRNLARNASATEYVWLVDVDVVPVPGAAAELHQFLGSRQAAACGRCVFVVPTYEVDEKERFPESAEQLLHLLRKKRARPFHEKVLIHNQFATNHSR